MSHSNPPPKPYEELIKKALFSNFLFFFTFARRTKKITFCFCKKFDENLQKKLIFHFLTLKSHFLNLHYVLRWETEKKEGKRHFFFNSQNFIISFYPLYTYFTFYYPHISSKNRKKTYNFTIFYILFFIFSTQNVM